MSTPIISFLIEKYIAPNRKIPRTVVFSLIVLNMMHVLLYPVWYGFYFDIHPIMRALPLIVACIWFLKFMSYHHIWHDVRYHVALANSTQNSNKKGNVKIKGWEGNIIYSETQQSL